MHFESQQKLLVPPPLVVPCAFFETPNTQAVFDVILVSPPFSTVGLGLGVNRAFLTFDHWLNPSTENIATVLVSDGFDFVEVAQYTSSSGSVESVSLDITNVLDTRGGVSDALVGFRWRGSSEAHYWVVDNVQVTVQ